MKLGRLGQENCTHPLITGHECAGEIVELRRNVSGLIWAKVADVTPVNVTKNHLIDVQAQLKIAQGFDVGLDVSDNQAALDEMVEAMVMGGHISL
ncbi:hypothetical protein SAMN04488032_101616 [Pacificibacter marinus]|uniref:L-threonine 3-dehydrogenase n=1 Tax=Pacificibacter marinus TaxID=658057 RepID=A0A1Y5R730_9RHOB|nr:hypothetical protein SAMN04488032_101616 [Pacificibacter marinus]SLN10682.1 L-threonine 3-dehydrogenase [Pacificibacter marinus]